MLTLVLETSTSRGSLALLEGERLRETHGFEALRGHNSAIFDPLESLLAGLSSHAESRLSRLVVGTGPGSYTGVRIAIAIADALALSHGAELVGASSFIGAECGGERDRYWMVGDARRQSWYRAEIRDGRLSGPVVTESRAAWEKAVRGAWMRESRFTALTGVPPSRGLSWIARRRRCWVCEP